MIEDDLRMPFKIAFEGYNQEEFVKVNVVSEQDWGWVNWNTAEFIDHDKIPEFYETTNNKIYNKIYNINVYM